MPGVGTLLGAAVGSIVGLFKNPKTATAYALSLVECQKKVNDAIRQQMHSDKYFASMQAKFGKKR